MTERIDAVASLVKLALDAASLNQTVIANNIANANTPGFVRGRVDFDSQLEAVRASLQRGGDVTPDMLSGVRPVLRKEARPAGVENGAQLDLDAAELAQNALQYQALVRALGKHMSMVRTAINEGKR